MSVNYITSEGVEKHNYNEPNIEVELSEDYPPLSEVDLDDLDNFFEIETATTIKSDKEDRYCVNVFSHGDKVVTVRDHPRGGNRVVVYDSDGTELFNEERERKDYTLGVLESVLDDF